MWTLFFELKPQTINYILKLKAVHRNLCLTKIEKCQINARKKDLNSVFNCSLDSFWKTVFMFSGAAWIYDLAESKMLGCTEIREIFIEKSTS